MTWILIAILAAVLVGLIVMIARAGGERAEASAPVEPDLASLSVTDARVGDTLSIPAVGDDYDDLTFTVDRRDRYEADGEAWFEFTGLYRGRRVYLEVYEDDEVEVRLNTARADLTLDDLGIGEDELAAMDESKDRSATISHEGGQWRYEGSGETLYYPGGRGAGEGYYGWEFREEGGGRTLYVEKWEDEPFEVGLAQIVHPADVAVFRSGK